MEIGTKLHQILDLFALQNFKGMVPPKVVLMLSLLQQITWQSFVRLLHLASKLQRLICYISSQFFTPFCKNCWGNTCLQCGVLEQDFVIL